MTSAHFPLAENSAIVFLPINLSHHADGWAESSHKVLFVLYEFLGRRSFIDPICCNFCLVLSMFFRLVLANSLFPLRDINLTLGLLLFSSLSHYSLFFTLSKTCSTYNLSDLTIYFSILDHY